MNAKAIMVAATVVCAACAAVISLIVFYVVTDASGAQAYGYGAVALVFMVLALVVRMLLNRRGGPS